jgi:DNA adenine methylase
LTERRRTIRLNGRVASEPPIRWAGGKRFLLDHVLKLLPDDYTHYYEPFLGGGALFFALQPKVAVLGDNNTELIGLMRTLRNSVEPLIRKLRSMRNTENDYYRIRGSKPRTAVGRAARLLYLTNLSFNGIYRVNRAGEFNVPYGYRDRSVYRAGDLRTVSKTLQSAVLIPDDFEVTVRSASDNDLVYIDPPYVRAHYHNGFVKYNAKIFSWDDQKRLALRAVDLANDGCHVIVSNAYHSSIRHLYADFRAKRVTRSTRMAADPLRRGSVEEYLFYSTV